MRRGAAIAAVASMACSHGQEGETSAQADLPVRHESDSPNGDAEHEQAINADVLAVRASGSPGAYTFAVKLRSPDTGCDQYADWWEVLTPQGTLVYRRVLMHSHVNEQPFTRSGGPVDVDATTEVVVRAHMNKAGYGGVALIGSIVSKFAADPSIGVALAPELSDAPPQPADCAF